MLVVDQLVVLSDLLVLVVFTDEALKVFGDTSSDKQLHGSFLLLFPSQVRLLVLNCREESIKLPFLKWIFEKQHLPTSKVDCV